MLTGARPSCGRLGLSPLLGARLPAGRAFFVCCPSRLRQTCSCSNVALLASEGRMGSNFPKIRWRLFCVLWNGHLG